MLKSYTSLRLLRQAQEAFDFNIKLATVNKFSFLTLAMGQKPLREYLGLPSLSKIPDFDTPVTNENINRLENLLTWLFGNGEKEPVISESRDITTYLKEIVRHEAAVTYLIERYNLLEAYDRTDGEEKMVVRYLNSANQKLEAVLGMAHRHKTDEVIEQSERCAETAERIVEAVRE